MASRPVCSLGRVKLNGSAFSGSTSRRLGYSEMALFGQNTESEMTDQYFKIANVLRRDAHFTVVFVSHRVWVEITLRASLSGTFHTPSTAFRHLPPNSARFSYATEGALFISAQLSSDAVSALRKVRVLIRLWKQPIYL